MPPHRVGAEEDRGGDLLVGRRGGEVVALGYRSTERRENAGLGVGQEDVGRGISSHVGKCLAIVPIGSPRAECGPRLRVAHRLGDADPAALLVAGFFARRREIERCTVL